ncbi:MAG: type IV secretion system protein [Neisseria sp.]|nr:type IV secretion system protein [Neisseria sp.]
MSGSYFLDMSNLLMNGMGSNLFAKSGNLISSIAPFFQAGFGLYMLLIALDYYKRGFDESIVDLSKRAIGWLVIIACAFNAGQYGKIANFLWGLPDGLSGLFGTSEYTASALDNNFNYLMDMWSKIQAYAAGLSFSEVSDKLLIYFTGIVILFLGGIFFIMTFAYYLVAKLSLAMVILIGPLFVASMLFPSTRQWGMNWIGQVLNYAITIVFFTILGALQNDFFNNHMKNVFTGEIFSAAIVLMALPVFVLGTLLFLIVALNIPSIAAALTGGASANTYGRQVGRMGVMAFKALRGLGGGSGGKVSK